MHKYFESRLKSKLFENYGDSIKKHLNQLYSYDEATSEKSNLVESRTSTSSLNSSYFNSTSAVKQNSSIPSISVLRKNSKSSTGLSLAQNDSSSLSSSSTYSESTIVQDSSDLALCTNTSTDTISTNYSNPNSSWFGDGSMSFIKRNLKNYSSTTVPSTSSSSSSDLEHSQMKMKYVKPGDGGMSKYGSKSSHPVWNGYRITEPHHKNVRLDSELYAKQKYRSDSLEFITPITVRIATYQQQLKKHESYCPLFRKEYQKDFDIGDRIVQMEKILSNKNEKKLLTFSKKGSYVQKPLRVATPDRAKELVEKYFNSAKSTSNNFNQCKKYQL